MTISALPDDSIPKPLLTVRSRRSWFPNDPHELWEYRGLLARFAARDVTLRYRQTILGIAWVVLQPLMAAGILSFVFGSVARLRAPSGVPYFLFSLVGLVAWNTFSQTLGRSGGALLANVALVSKVYFPRLLLPLSAAGSTLLDTLVSLVLVLILLISNRINPGWPALAIPMWLALMLFSAMGIGLATGSLMVRYRDVQYVVPVVVQFLLFASPIAYSLTSVPGGVRWAYELNPLTGLMEGFRWSVIGTPPPSPGLVLYSVAASLGILLVGIGIFNRAERHFADVI